MMKLETHPRFRMFLDVLLMEYTIGISPSKRAIFQVVYVNTEE
jgi:hypothetical protein